jgi:uncharacterized protein
MSRTVLVDTHMHIYESHAQGRSHKASYVISEYGPAKVPLSARAGDLDDALDSMAKAEFSFAVVANLFYTAKAGEEIVELCPGSADGTSIRHTASSARERLRAYNNWLCRLCETHPQLIPFVALDPWVMTSNEMEGHLIEMTNGFAVRGVKLHPVAQHIDADDERLLSVYRTCARLGIYVLAHSGTAGGNSFAEPWRFGRILRAVPTLKLVLAHLGGGAWHQVGELAEAFPSVNFDCSEIIAWAGAPSAPTQLELAQLIRVVGSHRVLMGTDFPWYDLDKTAEQVVSLPLLSDEEKELILGQNAINLLNLTIARARP